MSARTSVFLEVPASICKRIGETKKERKEKENMGHSIETDPCRTRIGKKKIKKMKRERRVVIKKRGGNNQQFFSFFVISEMAGRTLEIHGIGGGTVGDR
jgi:hypothetical protein